MEYDLRQGAQGSQLLPAYGEDGGRGADDLARLDEWVVEERRNPVFRVLGRRVKTPAVGRIEDDPGHLPDSIHQEVRRHAEADEPEAPKVRGEARREDREEEDEGVRPDPRLEADVQGEDIPDVIRQSIGTDGGMIAEGVGHLVDHEIGRDEPDLAAHMPVAEGKRCLAVPFREEPLGDDGSVYDRRLRSRHRRISFVLSYSLGPTWARNSSMRRAASRARRRSIGARSRSSRSRRRSTASRRTSDQLRSRIRAILFFIVPSTLKLTTSTQGGYYL